MNGKRSMMAAWAAAALAAQVPADAGIFRMYQGTAEIGRETFLETGTTLTSTVTIPLERGQADTLGAAMRAGGNRDVTVRVFPRLNHLFLVSPTDGSPSEYASLADTSVGADVLDTLATWLRVRLVRPSSPGRGRQR